jgi:hypothetical protein
VHHKLEELLDQYLKASGLEKEPGSPLFPAALGAKPASYRSGRSSALMPLTCSSDGSSKPDRRLTIRLTKSPLLGVTTGTRVSARSQPLDGVPIWPTAGPNPRLRCRESFPVAMRQKLCRF